MTSRIIITYLSKEVARASLATIMVLMIIMVSNTMGRVLADIADGSIPAAALWPAMLAQAVTLLSLIIPLGLFFGIIFAFGRLGKDHELVVMHACGIGYREFYLAAALVTAPLLLISILVSWWLNAEVLQYTRIIVQKADEVHEFSRFRAGQFNQSDDSDGVFYMESISDDQTELGNVIVGHNNADKMIIETGDRGRNKIDRETGDLFLEIGPGERFEGTAGEAGVRIVTFATHGILLEQHRKRKKEALNRVEKSLIQLMNSPVLVDKVELQWRINLPVGLLILMIIAVPLSHLAPRQGRFGKVGYALAVYIIYINLVAISRAQMEDGNLPLWLGFWWVQALFLLFGLYLLYRRNRGFALGRR